jgi:uncharacterized membrane protein HdeD (DUF308 family)
MSANEISTEEGSASRVVRRASWGIGLRGALAILLGIFALTRPAATMAAFIWLLSVYLLADGIMTMLSTFYAAARGRTWWPYLLEGLFSFVVGLWGIMRPSGMALAVLVLVAVRAIAVGFVEIGTGISARRTTGTSGVLLAVGGVISVIFGVWLVARPTVGLFALASVFGVYAIAFGVLLDGAALTGGRVARRLEHRTV